MSRVLHIHRYAVPSGDRKKYLDRARAARAHFTNRGCRFWLFEEIDLPGAFLAFVEADDAGTLEDAVSGAPMPEAQGVRLYREVELT
ncbi:MAG TPA: hypothetical protein VFK13_13810 [Gemmatimonadaceae bacterium]|nr:hypothetical protein [Gemmatimonadaceae bacterium]